MDKNCYIENVLNISGLDFVVWNDCRDSEEEFGIPHRVYMFMESFYQTLDYEGILNGNKVLQIETALGVCNLLIPGEKQIYVAGPYLTGRTSTADFFSNLINNNLPIEYEINVFYQSLSIFLEDKKKALRKLLELGLGIKDYQEIKQKQRIPTQEHLHTQFASWNDAEEAYNVLMQAEEQLYQEFQKGNPIAIEKAEEEYVRLAESIEYEFESHFLKENLQIANGLYQRFCAVRTKQFNQISSMYYQFRLEIQKVENLKDAIVMQRKMYRTYRRVMEQFEYQDYPYLVQQVFQYINGHWREKITLADIADELAVNKCYLSTVFNEATGMKITDCMQKLKIDWAEILLQSTTLKVVDVAFLCGFEDASYFGKVYKKQKGMTPVQAREK